MLSEKHFKGCKLHPQLLDSDVIPFAADLALEVLDTEDINEISYLGVYPEEQRICIQYLHILNITIDDMSSYNSMDKHHSASFRQMRAPMRGDDRLQCSHLISVSPDVKFIKYLYDRAIEFQPLLKSYLRSMRYRIDGVDEDYKTWYMATILGQND